jgi:hypothetical protein
VIAARIAPIAMMSDVDRARLAPAHVRELAADLELADDFELAENVGTHMRGTRT